MRRYPIDLHYTRGDGPGILYSKGVHTQEAFLSAVQADDPATKWGRVHWATWRFVPSPDGGGYIDAQEGARGSFPVTYVEEMPEETR